MGFEIGMARMIGAVSFSVIIGLIMAFIYRKEERLKKEEQMHIEPEPEKRPIWQTAFHFFALVLILVFANWGHPAQGDVSSTWYYIWAYKWYITGFFGLMLGYSLIRILKIKWQWVLIAALATTASALIASNLIADPKLKPSCAYDCSNRGSEPYTLFDKKDEAKQEWTLSLGIRKTDY